MIKAEFINTDSVLSNFSDLWPSKAYFRRMTKAGKIPHRIINRKYIYSITELNSWIADGCPQPAMRWAMEYRANQIKHRVSIIDEIGTIVEMMDLIKFFNAPPNDVESWCQENSVPIYKSNGFVYVFGSDVYNALRSN